MSQPKPLNGLFATQERSTANVDYRVWLEQRSPNTRTEREHEPRSENREG